MEWYPWGDEATPAGNGIAVQVLLRLGYLLGNADYIKTAEDILRAAWNDINQFPHAHNALINGLEELLIPTEAIIVRGPVPSIRKWQSALAKEYAPTRIVFGIPADKTDLPDSLHNYVSIQDEVVAYLCQGGVCKAPVSELNQFREALQPD